MGVKAKPAVFSTTDGEEFPTQIAAERHQAVLDAIKEHSAAVQKLGRALVEEQTTADGKPFEIRGLDRYWYLDEWCGDPSLKR